ncbi:diguanylate cyclase [Dokdonella koreensis]|nr:diguanylate cyclase [Dokdonella koreensis]
MLRYARPSLPLALLALLVPALASPVAAAPESGTVDAAIDRCLELRRSAPQAAVDLADSILASDALPVEARIKTLTCLGGAAGISGDGSRAAEVATQIQTLVDDHPDLPAPFVLRALSHAGAIFHSAGRTYQAETLYARVSDIARRTGGEDAIVTQIVMLTNIGLIHADYLDSPEVAEENYRQALALTEGLGRRDATLLYNLAVNRVRMGRDAEALDALERAERSADETGNVLVRARVRSARAGLLAAAGDTQRARALLQESIAVQKELPDPAGEAASLSVLSTVQRLAGEKLLALRTAEEALQRVERTSFQKEQVQALEAKVAAEAALGRTEAVVATTRRLHALQMTALKEQRLEILADLQARLQDAAAGRELERLRHQSEVQSLSLDKTRLARNFTVALLGLLALAAIAFGLMQYRRHRLLRELSAIDPLTGLPNRRTATGQLNALAAPAARGPVDTRHVLFLIDIDHFKKINDNYGHHAGDGVLIDLSNRLKAACRPSDIVARWGGEEFLVACADLGCDQAAAVAERLRLALAGDVELVSGQSRMLTVSVGFAPFPFFSGVRGGEAAGWAYAIRLADRALYAAKIRRNAWAGFWGAHDPGQVTAEDVLDAPGAAVLAGTITGLAGP